MDKSQSKAIAEYDNSKNSLDRPPDWLHLWPKNLIQNRFDSLLSYGYYNLSLHYDVDLKIALLSENSSSVFQVYTSTNLIRKDMETVMKSLSENTFSKFIPNQLSQRA